MRKNKILKTVEDMMKSHTYHVEFEGYCRYAKSDIVLNSNQSVYYQTPDEIKSINTNNYTSVTIYTCRKNSPWIKKPYILFHSISINDNEYNGLIPESLKNICMDVTNEIINNTTYEHDKILNIIYFNFFINN